MDRITRQVMFMEMAEAAAKRASCCRGNVGALVVRGNNVASIGYNGPPAGEPHCSGSDCTRASTGGCTRSIHAEDNALRRCPPGMIEGSDLYCTSSPCPQCAKLILGSGIHRVFYRHLYRLKEGLQALERGGVEVYKVTAAGHIIREQDGGLVSGGELV